MPHLKVAKVLRRRWRVMGGGSPPSSARIWWRIGAVSRPDAIREPGERWIGEDQSSIACPFQAAFPEHSGGSSC